MTPDAATNKNEIKEKMRDCLKAVSYFFASGMGPIEAVRVDGSVEPEFFTQKQDSSGKKTVLYLKGKLHKRFTITYKIRFIKGNATWTVPIHNYIITHFLKMSSIFLHFF